MSIEQTEMQRTLSRKCLIVIKAGNVEKEYVIEFPNTGDLMNIDLLKIQISDGRFDTLKFSFNPDFIKTATRIETIATFNVLLPQLRKDLNVDSMMKLQVEQMEVIEDAYTNQFLPWYEEWLVALNKAKKEAEVK